ncbi:hypothetical protein BH11ACT3_BH11ACT3_20590 [soil metagenome]
MTFATDRPTRQVPASDRPAQRGRRADRVRLPPLAIVTALGFVVVAAALRLIDISAAYNLFIDEATYSAIARDTTLATGPILHGDPFALHPPLALLILSAVAHVLGTQDIAALASSLRPFVAVVGSLTVGLLYLTLRRAGLRRAAFLGAALVALDPLIISFDSRVMLEAFAQLLAVLTIAAAIRAASAPASTRWRWTALTALAGAATFGSKETFGLVIFATLLLIAATAPRGDRRHPLAAAAGTLVGYALVNVAVINWSGFSVWWQMRTQGLARLLGTHQATGFKADGTQDSFWNSLLPNSLQVGATYGILALGGVCALSLMWDVLRRRPSVQDLTPTALIAVRVIAIWAVCACGYVSYAVIFGSLEEQMFYIAATACAVALAIRVLLIERRTLRRLAMVGVALLMVAQAATWTLVHTTSDDVYDQMLARVSDVAPEGSVISVTEETAQFVLTGYELGEWVTVPDLEENHVDFVLVSDHLVDHGYGLARPEFADEVRDHGTLVLVVQGRESDLELYDVRGWTS